ncbi:alpha/beta fold hydrolase [Microbacterium aurantiacum]|uniref:alpha/beta fold hydrolase n=1 Tax=Microbacterium aurantiacum TaxID=162393 RepID=UPI000C808AB9|nr:alpha/beta hydrolase [Microbacterium aurantiacum]
MNPITRERIRLSSDAELSFLTAGEPSRPTLLLLHGVPNSARMFEDVAAALAPQVYVVAPDLPGFGESDPLPDPGFTAFGEAISELLDRLEIGPLYLYVHDFGAPVAFHIAMAAPERVRGLIIQNANAHRSGFNAGWDRTLEYWAAPDPENEAAAMAHLTFEGTRDQYLSGVPADVTEKIPAERWEEDWRVMNLPGRMETQRALVTDYATYIARWNKIAEFLTQWQPPGLLIWGRHDIYFDLAETVSWMRDLPRMEAHIFDAGHLLLETHSAAAAPLIRDFIGD